MSFLSRAYEAVIDRSYAESMQDKFSSVDVSALREQINLTMDNYQVAANESLSKVGIEGLEIDSLQVAAEQMMDKIKGSSVFDQIKAAVTEGQQAYVGTDAQQTMSEMTRDVKWNDIKPENLGDWKAEGISSMVMPDGGEITELSAHEATCFGPIGGADHGFMDGVEGLKDFVQQQAGGSSLIGDITDATAKLSEHAREVTNCFPTQQGASIDQEQMEQIRTAAMSMSMTTNSM